jgi:NitT/TauT family transport system substrate-binding protein
MEAVRSGAVEGLCHVDPMLHYLEQKNELRIFADTRTLASTQRMFGGPLASACLFSRVEFLQAKPDIAQVLATGVVRALNWLKTAGPTDILKNVPSHHWMGDRAVYLGALDKVRDSYSNDGLFGQDALQTAWRARTRRLGGESFNLAMLKRSAQNQMALFAKRKFNI